MESQLAAVEIQVAGGAVVDQLATVESQLATVEIQVAGGAAEDQLAAVEIQVASGAASTKRARLVGEMVDFGKAEDQLAAVEIQVAGGAVTTKRARPVVTEMVNLDDIEPIMSTEEEDKIIASFYASLVKKFRESNLPPRWSHNPKSKMLEAGCKEGGNSKSKTLKAGSKERGQLPVAT
jgi:hypothetical protein